MKDLTITLEATNSFGETKTWKIVNSTALYEQLLHHINTFCIFADVEILNGIREEISLLSFNDLVHYITLMNKSNCELHFPTRAYSSTNEKFSETVDHYNKELYYVNAHKIKSTLVEIDNFVNKAPSLLYMFKNFFKKDLSKIQVLVQY